jgi:hypothetical protein
VLGSRWKLWNLDKYGSEPSGVGLLEPLKGREHLCVLREVFIYTQCWSTATETTESQIGGGCMVPWSWIPSVMVMKPWEECL